MKNTEFGQLLQLLGNLGVIVGILLLVYELNQNREMMQAQTRSSISDQLSNIVLQELVIPGMQASLMKMRNNEPLTPMDEFLLEARSTVWWRYRENVSYQYRNGLYEDSEYFPQREAWVRFLNEQDFTRADWCRRQNVQSEEFVAELNSLIMEPCD